MSFIHQKLLKGNFCHCSNCYYGELRNASGTDQIQITQDRKVGSAAVPSFPPDLHDLHRAPGDIHSQGEKNGSQAQQPLYAEPLMQLYLKSWSVSKQSLA